MAATCSEEAAVGQLMRQITCLVVDCTPRDPLRWPTNGRFCGTCFHLSHRAPHRCLWPSVEVRDPDAAWRLRSPWDKCPLWEWKDGREREAA